MTTMLKDKPDIQKILLSNIIPGIIHELNNPLNVLMMNVNMLKEDVVDLCQQVENPELQSIMESFEDMELALERIDKIAKSLNIVAVDSTFIETSGVDVNYLVQHATTLYHTRIKRDLDIKIISPKMRYMFAQVEPGLAITAFIIAIEGIISLGGERDVTVNLEPSDDGSEIYCTFIRKGTESILNHDMLEMMEKPGCFGYLLIPGGVKFTFISHEQALSE